MRIIFLDLDGVLNHCGINGNHKADWFEATCVAELNRITEITGAKLVLHSSWRRMIDQGHFTLVGFNVYLRSHGVNADLIGYTRCSDFDNDRADNVFEWLGRNPTYPYVILDDMDEGFSEAGMNFVQTSGLYGLTKTEADLAIKFLNGE